MTAAQGQREAKLLIVVLQGHPTPERWCWEVLGGYQIICVGVEWVTSRGRGSCGKDWLVCMQGHKRQHLRIKMELEVLWIFHTFDGRGRT